MLNVEMLSTGDEVLYGQIVDTNAAWLADYLFSQGLLLTRRSTTGDNLAQLVAILQERSQHADILIVNGGLGPTSDDLSAEAAAAATGDTLSERPEWIVAMEDYFAERGRMMAAANRKQACIPTRSELIDNPVGTACGFMLRFNRCLMFFTPGVPSEFRRMVEQEIMPRLAHEGLTGEATLCLRMTTFGRGESELAQWLDALRLPDGVNMGYRSAMPIIELKLTGPERLRPQMEAAWQDVRQVAGESALYEGTESLPSRLTKKLLARDWRVVTSEQASAGRLACALYSVNAPVVFGEVLAPRAEALPELLARAQRLSAHHQAEVALVIGALSAGQASFALVTPEGASALRVAFGIAHHAGDIQQEVMVLQALNMLRCGFNGWSLTTSRGWVTVEESLRV